MNSIASKVFEIQKVADHSLQLVAEIIATLRVNSHRFHFETEEAEINFVKLVSKWEKESLVLGKTYDENVK